MTRSRALAWTLGTVRLATGIWFVVDASGATRRWFGAGDTHDRYLVGSVGGRDVAIGAGLCHALATSGPAAPWILAGVAGDVADSVGAVTLDERTRRRTWAFAVPFGLLGLLALRGR